MCIKPCLEYRKRHFPSLPFLLWEADGTISEDESNIPEEGDPLAAAALWMPKCLYYWFQVVQGP